jgi:hypothetical protein
MTDLPPPADAPPEEDPFPEDPLNPEPPPVEDDALYASFCAQNGMDPNELSFGMRNEIVKLVRLTYENAWAFRWVGLTYNVRVEPQPDYHTAYFQEFIDHIMPLESKNRIRFETRWQEKLHELVELYKEKMPEILAENEPIGLFVPETSDKKLIVPGRD